jgi:hypothetical protein
VPNLKGSLSSELVGVGVMPIFCTFDGGGLEKPVLPGPPNKFDFNLFNVLAIIIVFLLNSYITIYML